MQFGVQTAIQNTTPQDVRDAWARIERAGYDWISVWDHFYAVGGGTSSLEAVAMHTALALDTTRVRCGSLVYSVGYRNLAVLVNAMATIDRLSGGRVTLGLGTGYMRHEYDAWGIPFPSARERLDHLEATVVAARRLFDGETVTVPAPAPPPIGPASHARSGTDAGSGSDSRSEPGADATSSGGPGVATAASGAVTLQDAVCDPLPLQRRLPIWIGGGGERRTIPMAARLADGWNVPMATVEDYARKVRVLDDHLERAGRAHDAIERSVGVGLCFDRSLLRARWGDRAEAMAPSILGGSTDEVIEQVAAYRAAGADWLFVSVRAPFDLDELDRFAAEVMTEFA